MHATIIPNSSASTVQFVIFEPALIHLRTICIFIVNLDSSSMLYICTTLHLPFINPFPSLSHKSLVFNISWVECRLLKVKGTYLFPLLAHTFIQVGSGVILELYRKRLFLNLRGFFFKFFFSLFQNLLRTLLR